MKIMDFLSKNAILPDIKSLKKQDVITELVDALVNAGEVEKRNSGKLIEALMAREALAKMDSGSQGAPQQAAQMSATPLLGLYAADDSQSQRNSPQGGGVGNFVGTLDQKIAGNKELAKLVKERDALEADIARPRVEVKDTPINKVIDLKDTPELRIEKAMNPFSYGRSYLDSLESS